MSEQSQMPLIGPLKQRGWHEIMRFRPISHTPHVALVVTRQGRLVGVIPADDRRVLSDYLTWPYDFYEVDTRERLLPIAQRVESRDAGYEFDAVLKLIYQVERPERVAIELQDALAELEQALVQSMRLTSRSFGVEQAKALEHNLLEALLYGDVLPQRLQELGLVLRRADVVIEFDERARARAEMLHNHMRDRPLMARLTLESLDSASSFDVLVGGSYRLISRAPTSDSSETQEAQLQDIIQRTLHRVAITFAPHDYEGAARAMDEALRYDSLLQTELATAELELVRTTVKIQPDRQMVIAAQSALPALPAPSARAYREPQRLTGPADSATQPNDDAPWGALGSMFGREAPPLAPPSKSQPLLFLQSPAQPPDDPAPLDRADQMPDAPDEILADSGAFYVAAPEALAAPADRDDDPAEFAGADLPADIAGDESNPTPLAWVAPDDHQPRSAGPDQPAPPWAGLGGAVGREDLGAFTSQSQPFDQQAPSEQRWSPAPALNVAQPQEVEVDAERVRRWITLLQADDPALFKLWALEIQGQPEVLPTILSALTDDEAILSLADDPAYQQALALALSHPSKYPPQAEAPAQPAGGATPPAAAVEADEDDTPPDWLRLRKSWHKDGGAA